MLESKRSDSKTLANKAIVTKLMVGEVGGVLSSTPPIEDLSDNVDWRSKMNSVFLGFMEQYYWFIFVISVVNTFCGV